MDLQIYDKKFGFKCISKHNSFENKLDSFSSEICFVEESEDKSFFNIWNNINYENWIYINDNLLKWIGISKKKFIKELKENYKINKNYKEYNNSEFKQLYITTGITTNNRSKHLIIQPKVFKMLLMILETSIGSKVRDYYINIQKKVIELSTTLQRSDILQSRSANEKIMNE